MIAQVESYKYIVVSYTLQKEVTYIQKETKYDEEKEKETRLWLDTYYV